jgi:hypothetical protein
MLEFVKTLADLCKPELDLVLNDYKRDHYPSNPPTPRYVKLKKLARYISDDPKRYPMLSSRPRIHITQIISYYLVSKGYQIHSNTDKGSVYRYAGDD